MSDELEYQDPGEDGSPSTPEDKLETPFPLDHKPGNARISHSSQMEGKDANLNAFTFYLPSYSLNYTTQLFRKSDSTPTLKPDDPALKEWVNRQKETTQYFTPGGMYQDLLEEEGQVFEQGVRHPDGRLRGIIPPKFKANQDGTLKGDMAVLKVSKALGLGEPVFVPLPHSGIVVTINPPTETDLIDFYGGIFREKIYLGRMTAGMTLTNMSAYINNRLFDFIVKHITAVNYADIKPSDLRNYMLIHDFPILVWGFASAMHPNGFDFSRSCSFDLTKCQHEVRGIINLLYLYWINNTALTQYQRETLYEARPNGLSLDTYRKYIGDHTRVKSQEITLSSGLIFRLKVPTFGEHIADGLAWVNAINTAIDNVIVMAAPESESDKVRQETLQQYVSASILRQFSHFVEHIETEGEIIQDRDSINKVLTLLSADDKIRPELSSKIIRFKADTTVALIGLEEYKCPSCGQPQQPEPVSEAFATVIPIDVMMTFFTLVTLRISRIMERE